MAVKFTSAVTVATLALLATSALAQAVYRYKDSQGNTDYTDKARAARWPYRRQARWRRRYTGTRIPREIRSTPTSRPRATTRSSGSKRRPGPPRPAHPPPGERGKRGRGG